jgi:hypothetical protein
MAYCSVRDPPGKYFSSRQDAGSPNKKGGPWAAFFVWQIAAYNSGTIKSATMLMILMSGFTAGPAVSL